MEEEIIRGRRLSKQDDLSVFEYAKRCSEFCRFCAQSAFNQTDCEKYEMLDEETILRDCKAKESV